MRTLASRAAHRFDRVFAPFRRSSGLDGPRRTPVESSPVVALRKGPARSRATLAAAAIALGISLVAFGKGAYIYAKAGVAQCLLERAWRETQRTGVPAKPWPWADTQTLARLSAPRQGVEMVVLAGASGRSLAFAPGHLDGSANPDELGNIVFAGHRDTHFRFLRDLAVGDALVLQDRDGKRRGFRVRDAYVADAHELALPRTPAVSELTLVTCYPFDALLPGGTLRYVVVATEVLSEAAPRAFPASASLRRK